MRFGLLAVLVLGLATTAAHAEDRPTKPRVGKVGVRVVQVFADTQQALVLNQDTGKHVVVGEGDKVGRWEVVEIGEDSVVVRAGGRELVLVAPATGPTSSGPTASAPGDQPEALRPKTGLLDPYAGTAPAARPGGPVDPYAAAPSVGGGAEVREVLAPTPQRAGAGPVDPYAPARPTVGPTVATPTVATPTVATPTVATPTVATPPAPAGPEAIRVESLTIKKAELSAALADFDRLAKELGFARTPRGVRLATVPTSSYVWRLGLRPGDVVTAIDGAPLRTLDDAAAAYVRLGSAKKLTIAIERAGATGTLRFALQ
jgi:hypothetical protein